MVDIAFNGRVRKDNLFKYRPMNSSSEDYIVALDIAHATSLLASCNIKPDRIEACGYLVVPLRTDVEK